MRYRPLIVSLLLAAAGCTGTRISSTKLAELQSTAVGSAATRPANNQANTTLWYVGSKLVYDYYVYEFDDLTTGQHVSHTYHAPKVTDDTAPASHFLYTTDRAKWLRIAPPPHPAGVTLDDLHT